MDKKDIRQEIFEIDTLNILDCSKLKFEREESGYMTLEFEGQTYHKVNLTRLKPFYSKTTYISVSYENSEGEFKEIGVIRDMAELPKDEYEKVDSFLEFKYYMPEITKIFSIKDNRRGYIFIDLETTSGRKTVCIRDWYSNFRMLTEHYLYVSDADGNKYFCSDVEKLDKKSQSIMEMYV